MNLLISSITSYHVLFQQISSTKTCETYHQKWIILSSISLNISVKKLVSDKHTLTTGIFAKIKKKVFLNRRSL